MESNTNNISSVGLHGLGLDQRQRRCETSEEVDVRQGQNALSSLFDDRNNNKRVRSTDFD